MNQQNDDIIHVNLALMGRLGQLLDTIQPKKRLLHTNVVQLSTTQASGQQVVSLPFPTEYLTVYNQTAANLYVAGADDGVQPLDAIPIPANVAQTFPITETQRITVYQYGIAQSGTNAVVIQASNVPIAMSAVKL